MKVPCSTCELHFENEFEETLMEGCHFWQDLNLAYVISFYFFLKAILLNGEAWKKKLPYNPKAIVPTIWGFAFGILGHLGVFIIAG